MLILLGQFTDVIDGLFTGVCVAGVIDGVIAGFVIGQHCFALVLDAFTVHFIFDLIAFVANFLVIIKIFFHTKIFSTTEVRFLYVR